MNYKDKLKYLREEKEVTQKEVAKALNISRSAYNNYEAQISYIPIKHLNNLCNYFDISIDYLFGLSSIKNYPNACKVINKIKAGNRLIEFRKEQKLSREKLGNILNTVFGTISFYEKGRNLISTPFLYTICSKYNISADYLLGRIDNPKYLKKPKLVKKEQTKLNYGEKLKELREYNINNRRITQKEIADFLNISLKAYIHYEHQENIIPVKHLSKICNYFNTSVDYLFGLSSTKNYPNSKKEIDKIKAGNRLKNFRKEQNLTQKKLADILNTVPSNIAFYEKGRNLISTSFLYTICSKYNISADYLLGRIANPKYLR